MIFKAYCYVLRTIETSSPLAIRFLATIAATGPSTGWRTWTWRLMVMVQLCFSTDVTILTVSNTALRSSKKAELVL